jgi:hypothetical protein
MSSYLLHQLYLIRSQLELAIAMAEGASDTQTGPPACLHPEEKRKDMSTMGGEREFFCFACEQTVKGVA